MKKFFTLSAVALAGATMGVGSTFGWWAEDAPMPKENVQPADSPAPVPTPIESVPTLAPLEVPIAPVLKRIEISGPDEVRGDRLAPAFGEFPVMSQFSPAYVPGPATTGISRDDADRLTKELIKEAEELEKKGQKEAAEIHRKLISRLQRTPRRVVPVPAQGSTVNMLPALPGMGMPYISPVTPPDSAPNVAGRQPAVRVEYRDVPAIDPLAVSLGQRATHFEHEARQAEEQGQTDVANEKRKLAAQLREIEKQFPTQTRKVAVYQSLPGAAASPAAGVVRASKIQFAPLDAQTQDKIAELAKDIERDADRLEKEGKKDAAEAQRSAARRIRETLPKIEFGTAKGWVKIEAVSERNLDPSAISELDKELLSLKEAAAKTDDPEVRKQLMAKAFELGVKRQMLQSNLPKLEIRERKDLLEKEHLDSAIRSLKEDIRNVRSNVEQPELREASNDSQLESITQDKPRDSGEKVFGDQKRQKALAMALHNYAHQLRAQGHRDQAQALLDQANELEHRSLPSVTRSELFPKVAESNSIVQEKEPLLVTPAKPNERKSRSVDVVLNIPVQKFEYERLLQKLKQRFPQSKLRLLQESPSSDKMVITGRVADSEDVASIRQFIQDEVVNQRREADPHIVSGPNSGEIHRILKSLHHEITALRSEVRDLRSVIKEESRNEKRDAKAAKESEPKDKPSDDQKATDAKDESKKPAESVEDKPQLDD